MTRNKIHCISHHKPFSFDMLSLVTWLDSLITRHRHKGQTELQLWMSVCVYACLPWTICSMVAMLAAVACLVNRSANTASCALLIFLIMGTSIWWTFSLCCTENSNFNLSPCPCPPPIPNHSISLTYRSLSIILTLSLLPLLFSNLVSIRMLNLGRNDTYGVTKGKIGEKRVEARDRVEAGRRWDPLILERDELCCIRVQ